MEEIGLAPPLAWRRLLRSLSWYPLILVKSMQFSRPSNRLQWLDLKIGHQCNRLSNHYNDVIMGTIASQIISLTIIYSTVYSDTDQRKHQSSASLAFVRGIHRGPVNSPHKRPVTRKIFSFDDVIMIANNVTYSIVSLAEPATQNWTLINLKETTLITFIRDMNLTMKSDKTSSSRRDSFRRSSETDMI